MDISEGQQGRPRWSSYPQPEGIKRPQARTTTMASTCVYALTASPTIPTSGPQLTSFHATNHATPLRTGAVRHSWTASPGPASAVSRALSEFHGVRVGEAKISLPALARVAVTRAMCSTAEDDSRVAGNPAAHSDWPMYAVHSESGHLMRYVPSETGCRPRTSRSLRRYLSHALDPRAPPEQGDTDAQDEHEEADQTTCPTHSLQVRPKRTAPRWRSTTSTCRWAVTRGDLRRGRCPPEVQKTPCS